MLSSSGRADERISYHGKVSWQAGLWAALGILLDGPGQVQQACRVCLGCLAMLSFVDLRSTNLSFCRYLRAQCTCPAGSW